jgi:hypothetical protein
MVHKRSEFAQKVHGLRAKLYAKKRHAEKVEMKKKYVLARRNHHHHRGHLSTASRNSRFGSLGKQLTQLTLICFTLQDRHASAKDQQARGRKDGEGSCARLLA